MEVEISDTPIPTWHGIPREDIVWHPTIIYETNKPVVAAPQTCMVGCTTCAVLCTQDAIEFPSVGYVRQIIRKNKLVSKGKNTFPKATQETP